METDCWHALQAVLQPLQAVLQPPKTASNTQQEQAGVGCPSVSIQTKSSYFSMF